MRKRSTFLALTALSRALSFGTAALAHNEHRDGAVVTPHVVVMPAPRVVRPATYCAGLGCDGEAIATGPMETA